MSRATPLIYGIWGDQDVLYNPYSLRQFSCLSKSGTAGITYETTFNTILQRERWVLYLTFGANFMTIPKGNLRYRKTAQRITTASETTQPNASDVLWRPKKFLSFK